MQTGQKVVSIYDTAIDALKIDGNTMLEFCRTRNSELLEWKSGKEPTFFHVRRIDAHTFFDFVEAGASESERERRAFYAAVEKIENLTALDGKSYVALNPSGERRNGQGAVTRYFTDDEVGLVPPAFIRDVGNWARQQSFFPEGGGGFYQPPPSLAMHWAARLTWERVEAERSATSQPAANEPQTPSPSSTAPPASGSKATE